MATVERDSEVGGVRSDCAFEQGFRVQGLRSIRACTLNTPLVCATDTLAVVEPSRRPPQVHKA
eukprot:6518392-Pyramimonas_sp.AAC.1